MFDAKVILASRNTHGQRITSMEVVMPRYILAELNTHRMLSKNSASSRAIKFEKMVEAIKANPFVPMKWMKNHTGMQGTAYYSDTETCAEAFGEIDRCYHYEEYRDIPAVDYLKRQWILGMYDAIAHAEMLNTLKVTKQMTNRLLEPYMWHKVLITATEWENFFALRAHPDADIHMQHLAHLMLEAYNNAKVQELKEGEWHLPYANDLDKSKLYSLIEADHGVYDPIIGYKESKGDMSEQALVNKYKLKISTARCAQTSYTVIGEDEKQLDYSKLVSLHDRLAGSGHMSPFEHCAKAMSNEEYQNFSNGYKWADINIEGWCGNFRGFIQYRKTFEGENRKDSRVKP